MKKDQEMRPGENVAASIARIRLWLKLHPDSVSVSGQIGSSDGFISDGWPYRLYAVDRRDLEAALDLIEKTFKEKEKGRE